MLLKVLVDQDSFIDRNHFIAQTSILYILSRALEAQMESKQ